jgi:acyl carrier protein
VSARTLALRDELRTAISNWDLGADPVADDTPLISSARLDSFNLVRLLLWVEGEIGRSVDATQIDLAVDWDTVEQIVTYVELQRATDER